MSQRSDTDEFPLTIDTRWELREMVDMAVFLGSAWLIIGLLLVPALAVGEAWLLLLGLASGIATGLYAAVLFRRDARLAESAARALAAEVSDQGLIAACSREPRLQLSAGPSPEPETPARTGRVRSRRVRRPHHIGAVREASR
jgi:hypothetical protein